MKSSQMKKAIDETISNEPMMDEAFVQRVLHGKKHPKKLISFLQPAIVAVVMLMIGTALYFTPTQTEQSAVEIKSYNLTETQQKHLNDYYTAIVNKDKKALVTVAIVDDEDVFKRYKAFDMSKQFEVVKTIETPQQFKFYVKLRTATESYLDHLLFDKESQKFILNKGYEISYYVEELELPKTLSLKYKLAPIATPMKSNDINLDQAESTRINGNTFYQLETKRGMKRIFETFSGERFDLGIVSEGISYYSVGHDNQFYFIDALTKNLTFVYLNDDGDYQILTGELEERSITAFQSHFHEEEILITVGEQPKIMTIQQGQLVYANIFELAEFENPKAFYSTEATGLQVLVEYSDDSQQISTYYEFTAPDMLMDYRKIDILEAKPEHLRNMVVQNRNESRIIYKFNNGTLYYTNDILRYYEKSKSEDEKPYAGEISEGTYTNIQIQTEGNQYFITGDDGFNWTLTRIGPRILVDENGIEYTVPYAFENIPQISDVLLEDKIQSLGIYKIGGLGTYAYVLEENLDEVNELFGQATVNKEYPIGKSGFMIDIEYENGNRVRLELWLNEGEQASNVMKNDVVNNTITFFKIPEALASHFRELVGKIEEYDNSK